MVHIIKATLHGKVILIGNQTHFSTSPNSMDSV